MKNKIIITLMICSAVILCSCGVQEVQPSNRDSLESVLPDSKLVADDGTIPNPTVTAGEDLDETDYEELILTAKSIYLKDVYSMLEKLGQPEDKLIAPSARGKGKDGVYKYKNIVAYTYSEGSENVVGVAVIDDNGEEIFYLPEIKDNED